MKKRELLLLFFFMFLSVVAYYTDVSSSKYLRPLMNTFSGLLLPIHELKGNFVRHIEEKVNTYFYLVDVQRKNAELSKRLEELYLYRALYDECRMSLDRLSENIDVRSSLVRRYAIVNSKVIGYDHMGRDEFILINKGRVDGLEEGFLVFSAGMLVGVVERVFSTSSRVLTVYSNKFNMSATLLEARKNYFYQGGWKEGRLLYVGQEDEVKVGQKVVLRDTREVIPAFFIGMVSNVESNKEDFFKKVYVKPYADIRRLEYVSVLKVKP